MPETVPTIPVRETRALRMLSADVRIIATNVPGEYIVPSESRHAFYKVRLEDPEAKIDLCTCPDAEGRLPAPCKHIYVVRKWLAADTLEAATRLRKPPAPRQRPKAQAQTKARLEEGRLFPILLREACTDVAEPPRAPHKAGRPPTPLRDQLFCAIQKVQVGLSGCRSHGHRVTAAASGFIDKVPYWDVTSKVLCREDVTPILLEMVTLTAHPFAALCDRAAVDSTGLRLTQFKTYRRDKYTPDQKNEYLKLHGIVDTDWHAILAAEVSVGTANDSPFFKPLVERAFAAGFRPKEILADKAYQSRENHDLVARLGAEAYIPFKSNSTGQSKGSFAYHQMFIFFQYHREKFEAHYRWRGQIEIAWGVLKQTIGEDIHSRNFTARVNEALCKAVAHNIRMLIQAMMFGAGVLPDFLQPPSGSPAQEAPEPSPIDLASFNLPEPPVPVVEFDGPT